MSSNDDKRLTPEQISDILNNVGKKVITTETETGYDVKITNEYEDWAKIKPKEPGKM